MDVIAKSYVYVTDDGKGYVGRHPESAFPGRTLRLIGRAGDRFPEEAVEAMGLSDLEDRTDYRHARGWEQTYTLPAGAVAVRSGRAKGEIQPKPKGGDA